MNEKQRLIIELVEQKLAFNEIEYYLDDILTVKFPTKLWKNHDLLGIAEQIKAGYNDDGYEYEYEPESYDHFLIYILGKELDYDIFDKRNEIKQLEKDIIYLEKKQNELDNLCSKAYLFDFTEPYWFYRAEYDLRLVKDGLGKNSCYLDKENWVYDLDISRIELEPCFFIPEDGELARFVWASDNYCQEIAIWNCLIKAKKVGVI